MTMKKIILPLDNISLDRAMTIIKTTKNLVWGFKIRKLIVDYGLSIVKVISDYGSKVMVDFKLYDIPMAMEEMTETFINAGADIVTVHCTADWKPEKHADKIAGVTILTSMKEESFKKFYDCTVSSLIHKYGWSIAVMVWNMAKNAESYNYGYIVSSAQELIGLSKIKCKKICPGIRPDWYQTKDDQERTMTPKEAIKAGADLLVIGRPILNSPDIIEALEKTNAEIEEV